MPQFLESFSEWQNLMERAEKDKNADIQEILRSIESTLGPLKECINKIEREYFYKSFPWDSYLQFRLQRCSFSKSWKRRQPSGGKRGASKAAEKFKAARRQLQTKVILFVFLLLLVHIPHFFT